MSSFYNSYVINLFERGVLQKAKNIIIIRNIIFLILMTFLISCSGMKEIRIKNETGSDMTGVTVNFVGQHVAYGDIEKGEYSEYKKVKKAYGYAVMRWFSNGEEHYVQPVDYVGEKELGSGKYTYIVIPSDNDKNYHWIRLQKD